jgi:DNA polymerase
MARIIFGKTTISKDERWVGKQTELGCGFGMGKAKFFAQCLRLSKTYGIKGVVVTEDLAALSVGAYRKMHYKVRELWYYMDNAARAAIAAPGGTFTAGKCAFAMKKVASVPFLVMTLPSGRNLFYPHPKIEIMKVHEEDLEGDKCITFYGQLPSSTQWGQVKIWGGTFAENATQAVAADLMAGGALESERVGIEPFALIHDQALAPRKPGQTAEQFCTALTRLPAWAVGLPFTAEGKEVPYYLKL